MVCGDGLLHNLVHYKSNPNVYMLMTTDSLLLLVMYVDDLLIINFLNLAIAAVKSIFHDSLLMMDMDLLHFFVEISQDASRIKMS